MALSIEVEYGNTTQAENLFIAWMVENGANIGMFQGTFQNGEVACWDVEIHESRRGQGLSTRLFELVQEHFSVDCIVHSGQFTKEGFLKISGKFSRPAWAGEARPVYSNMNFVYDWEKRELQH